MKNLMLAMGIFFTAITTFAQTCPQPFFSEYIEGSSNNKAMEIYNPGNAAIDLEDYVVYRFNNGADSATDSLFPIGILEAHEVFVFGNPSAVTEIIAESDTLHTMTYYNGNDAIILVDRITGDTLDAIGVIGEDPGTNWPVGIGATSEFTLVRKVEVTVGTTDWALGATQWDVYPQNTFDYLGLHDSEAIAPLFTADWTSSAAGFTVAFTDASTGPVSTYEWTFGDGASSTEANPSHTYASSGDYEVCLIVGGCDTPDTLCATITVCDAGISDFTYVIDGLTATFTNESDGAIVSYAWDFGDGASSSEENPVHTYAEDGEYAVCLIISNDCSVLDTMCQTILINTTGISELNLTNVTVYPNPFNTQFTINLGANFELVYLLILDINGRVIETKTVSQSTNVLVDLNIEAGVYFVQLTADNETKMIKMIKK